MPRHHTIWNHELKRQVDVLFTPEEEIARDAEEVAAAAKKVTVDERQEKIAALKAKIIDGSATHAELLEFMQYNIGAK